MTTENQNELPNADAFASAFMEALTVEEDDAGKVAAGAAAGAAEGEGAAGAADADAGKDAGAAGAAAADAGAADPAGEAGGEGVSDKGNTGREGAQAADAGAAAGGAPADGGRAQAPAGTSQAPARSVSASGEDGTAKGDGAGEVKPEPLFTKEEEEFLKQYDADWSDVKRGEALIRRAEYGRLVEHIFSEVFRVFGPALQYTETAATADHTASIYEAHSDYDAIHDGLVQWIDSQPAYLKSAYSQVAKEGTAQEVIDMISRYKEASGIAAQGEAPKTEVVVERQPAAAAAAKADAQQKAKQAAQKLSVVGGKRSTPSSSSDPNDFEGAFKEFAAG